jgi:hypothetical protein
MAASLENIEDVVKAKIQSAFDLTHIYEIFGTLISAVRDQQKEIEYLKQNLSDSNIKIVNIDNKVIDVVSKVDKIEIKFNNIEQNIQELDARNKAKESPRPGKSDASVQSEISGRNIPNESNDRTASDSLYRIFRTGEEQQLWVKKKRRVIQRLYTKLSLISYTTHMKAKSTASAGKFVTFFHILLIM